jgi:hypothetical protein
MSIDETEKPGNTGKDGDLADTQTAQTVPETDQKQDAGGLAAPFVGFDGDGFFVFRIDGRYGYHAIQGHLAEASQWLRSVTIQQQRKQMEATQKIIKPNKFGGRFNLFK